MFQVEQALSAGCSRTMVHRRAAIGRWERVYPRVYRITGTAPSCWQSLMVVRLWAGEGMAFSHRTAAELHGLLVPRSSVIEVTTERQLRAPDRRVHLHWRKALPKGDVEAAGPFPVTPVDLTLLDVAASLEAEALERCIDDALRRDLLSLPRLRWRLERSGGKGRVGTAALGAGVRSRARGYRPTDGPLEDDFLTLCRRGSVPEPQRQVEVAGLGRVDFYYPDARIVIELDGYEYHWDRRAFQNDRSRNNALGVEGILVLRYTSGDVRRRADDVAAEILEARRFRLR